MKTSTKLFSLLMAVMMLLSLTITAFGADPTYILKINGQYSGHTYKAYQVFDGTLDDVYIENENGTYYELNNGTYTTEEPTADNIGNYKDTTKKYIKSTELKNIVWGTGVNGDELLAALKDVATDSLLYDGTAGKSLFEDCKNAADVADVIKDFDDNQAQIDAFADIVSAHLNETETAAKTAEQVSTTANAEGFYEYEFKNLDAGYYFVKDVTSTSVEGTLTKYMLQVVKDTTVTAKADKPTLEKYIYREVGEGETGTYYKLKNGTFTTVAPTDATKDQYANNGKAYILDKINEAGVGEVVDFRLEATVPEMDGYDSYTFTVKDTMSKGLTFNNDVIITVNGEAVPKDEGTSASNGVYYTLKTNSTDAGMEITIEFLNFINYKDTNKVGTPIVITYSATVNEDAEVGNLPNTNTANLTYSKNPNMTPDPEHPDVIGTTPDSKTYTYVAEIKLTKVDGDTQHRLTGAEFQISGMTAPAVITEREVFVEYTEADAGNEVTPYWRLTDGTYTETDPNGNEVDKTKYEDINKKYKKETITEVIRGESSSFTAKATVGDDGVLTFSGLGAGTYTITEIKAPDGYNSLEAPITIVVDFNGTVTGETPTVAWTVNDASGATVDDDGIINLIVENRTGSTLPSTGGIGTTIFYVLGGLLAVGAVVLLVTRKRMEESAK